MTVTAHALNAAHCFEMLGIAKVDQGIKAGDGFKNDIATFTAISTVGAAILDIFFTAEAYSTRPARTRANKNFGLIKKMHGVAFRGGWPIWPVARDFILLCRDQESLETISLQVSTGPKNKPK